MVGVSRDTVLYINSGQHAVNVPIFLTSGSNLSLRDVDIMSTWNIYQFEKIHQRRSKKQWMEKGENKNVKYFFQILELAWAGRKMAKLKLQRTLWPLAGPTLYSYFLFYCDFEFGSIELSIHSIVLACGWYRWIWISETLHAPRLTQDNCIKNGIQMTREAKEEELAPAISQSTILKESLMWDILRLICELFPKSKMIQ